MTATVKEVIPLTNSVLQLIIEPDQYVAYEPGQYLEILVNQQWQAYSIANAALGARHYELHIRHGGGNPYDEPLFKQIREQGILCIRLPFGHCTLSRLDTIRPILMIAGGTGFAPVKAMIEHLLATDDKRTYSLWWAARSASDLYMDEKLRQWQAHVEQFHYHSFQADSGQKAMVDLVNEFYGETIHGYQLVLAGPFEMVYATRDRLVQMMGVDPAAMIADAFDFEEKS